VPRGGSRKHPKDCQCGNCPKLGRKKQERPTNANVAARVLARAKAEETWLELINLEKERLGLNAPPLDEKTIAGPFSWYRPNFSIIPLTNLLRYLECRAYGNPTDTVNHLHDKPIEHHMTFTLSERFRIALEKGDKRVSGRS
jgi:hypothetical protein